MESRLRFLNVVRQQVQAEQAEEFYTPPPPGGNVSWQLCRYRRFSRLKTKPNQNLLLDFTRARINSQSLLVALFICVPSL
jgi:hypothetical protein